MSVFTASVPLGAKVENLPPAKNFIDELVFANLKQLGIPPSPLCDDGTFLRRASIDIAGHLPTLDEARRFLAENDLNKRDHLIESLLSSSDYADYFANKWSALLKNKRDVPTDKTSNFAFHFWLRDSLLANKPYDQIVRELLGATGNVVENPAVAWYKRAKTRRRNSKTWRAFSRRSHALRTVSSSPLRALEPEGLLQLFRLLQPGWPAADRQRGRGRDFS